MTSGSKAKWVSFSHSFGLYSIEGKLNEMQESITKALLAVEPTADLDTCSVYIDVGGYGDNEYRVGVRGNRPITYAEILAFEEAQKRAKELIKKAKVAREQRELKEYERLRKKYGK